MLVKVIKYTDFNDNPAEMTAYFNLTRTELIELESEENGLTDIIVRIGNTPDPKVLMPIFKRLILMSYGMRSSDGTRFQKSEAISADFQSTAAYDELFVTLATNADEAYAFLIGLMPKGLAEMVKGKTNEELAQIVADARNVTAEPAATLPFTPPLPPPTA